MEYGAERERKECVSTPVCDDEGEQLSKPASVQSDDGNQASASAFSNGKEQPASLPINGEGAKQPTAPAPARGKDEKQPSTPAHKLLTVVGVVLCVVLLPILIVNCTLIVRSFLNPDEVPGIGGNFPLIVMSDSMYPEIQKGDLIICRQADTDALQVGDVIAFYERESQENTVVVTHRIIGVDQGEDGPEFTTQGDANDSADLHKTVAADVIGTYQTRLPGIGSVAMFMQSTPGLVVCVLVPIVLLVGYDIVRSRLVDKRRKTEAAALQAELESLRAAKGSDAS